MSIRSRVAEEAEDQALNQREATSPPPAEQAQPAQYRHKFAAYSHYSSSNSKQIL